MAEAASSRKPIVVWWVGVGLLGSLRWSIFGVVERKIGRTLEIAGLVYTRDALTHGN